MRTIGGSLLAVFLLMMACTVGDTTAPPAISTTPGLTSSTVVVTNPACGDVIVSDLRLEQDLSCAGDGLTVTGSGIKINLNGHTIAGAGPGTGLGIRVLSSQDVSIFGGTVRSFLRGINVSASTGIIIKDNELSQNGTGILLEFSSGNTIKSNVARQNTLRAIMIRPNLSGSVVSTDNDVKDNVLIDNPTGIYVIRQPGNMFKGNIISGSTIAAIDLDPAPLGASGNVFKGNLLESSGAGIRFGAGWTGNTILGNTVQTNTCAFKGPTSGNAFQGNTLTGNTTDFCP
jgi:parallel beta-helix repeat protein